MERWRGADVQFAVSVVPTTVPGSLGQYVVGMVAQILQGARVPAGASNADLCNLFEQDLRNCQAFA